MCWQLQDAQPLPWSWAQRRTRSSRWRPPWWSPWTGWAGEPAAHEQAFPGSSFQELQALQGLLLCIVQDSIRLIRSTDFVNLLRRGKNLDLVALSHSHHSDSCSLFQRDGLSTANILIYFNPSTIDPRNNSGDQSKDKDNIHQSYYSLWWASSNIHIDFRTILNDGLWKSHLLALSSSLYVCNVMYVEYRESTTTNHHVYCLTDNGEIRGRYHESVSSAV